MPATHVFLLWVLAFSALSGCQHAPAKPRPVNYDEAKAGAPSLPDPLLCEDGKGLAS